MGLPKDSERGHLGGGGSKLPKIYFVICGWTLNVPIIENRIRRGWTPRNLGRHKLQRYSAQSVFSAVGIISNDRKQNTTWLDPHRLVRHELLGDFSRTLFSEIVYPRNRAYYTLKGFSRISGFHSCVVFAWGRTWRIAGQTVWRFYWCSCVCFFNLLKIPCHIVHVIDVYLYKSNTCRKTRGPNLNSFTVWISPKKSFLIFERPCCIHNFQSQKYFISVIP